MNVQSVWRNSNSKRTKNFVMNSGMPDITVTYVPEITFLLFFCNFGGLLGMWLGISVKDFLEFSIFFFRKKYRERKSRNTKIFILNNAVIISNQQKNINDSIRIRGVRGTNNRISASL